MCCVLHTFPNQKRLDSSVSKVGTIIFKQFNCSIDVSPEE